jgi:hypothetical protein
MPSPPHSPWFDLPYNIWGWVQNMHGSCMSGKESTWNTTIQNISWALQRHSRCHVRLDKTNTYTENDSPLGHSAAPSRWSRLMLQRCVLQPMSMEAVRTSKSQPASDCTVPYPRKLQTSCSLTREPEISNTYLRCYFGIP